MSEPTEQDKRAANRLYNIATAAGLLFTIFVIVVLVLISG